MASGSFNFCPCNKALLLLKSRSALPRRTGYLPLLVLESTSAPGWARTGGNWLSSVIPQWKMNCLLVLLVLRGSRCWLLPQKWNFWLLTCVRTNDESKDLQNKQSKTRTSYSCMLRRGKDHEISMTPSKIKAEYATGRTNWTRMGIAWIWVSLQHTRKNMLDKFILSLLRFCNP